MTKQESTPAQMSLELTGTAERDDPAAIDQRELITVFRLVHVMSRDDHGDAARGEIMNQIPKRSARRDLRPEVGSSKKKDRGAVQHCTAKREALFPSTGQRAGDVVVVARRGPPSQSPIRCARR